jgi:predicted Rossmann fold nucleotide-binding protein DprA/Smf involved in DNA uptake
LQDSLRVATSEQNNSSLKPEPKPLNHPLLQFIGAESTPMNAIILGSGLTTGEVSSILLELELTGAIAVAPDGGYVNVS